MRRGRATDGTVELDVLSAARPEAGTPSGGPVLPDGPTGSDRRHRRDPRSYLWAGVLTLVGAVTAATAFVPGSSRLEGTVVLGVAVLVFPLLMLAVIRLPHSRPGPWWRQPWVMIGFGLAGQIVAATSLVVDPPRLVGVDLTLIPAAAGLWVASTGLVRLLGDRVRRRSVDLLFESAIGAASCGVVLWVTVAVPSIQSELIRPVAALAAVLCFSFYLLAGLLAGRLFVASGRATGPACLLAGIGTLVLASLFGTAAALRGLPPAGPQLALILVGIGLWGASAIHPAVAVPSGSVPTAPARLGAGRLGLLGVAVVIGPALLLLGPTSSPEIVVPTIAITGGLLSLLTVIHLVRLVHEWGRLEHQVGHDPLTGLPNRSLFDDQVTLALAVANHTDGTLAVMFLDLDRFKVVNDSLGHAAGNLLLQAVARRLQHELGSPKIVARLSGDEFAVLLPDISSSADSRMAAEKVLKAFAGPFHLARKTIYVSPSIGIAHFPADGADADTLLRNADAAMYRAKDRGRNTYALYTSDLNASRGQRLSLESELHTAIERNELVLHYQPKVDLRTGRIAGAEALVRWQHPTLGLLGPDEFVPLAEETGLIGPLGEWVLEQACAQSQAWRDAGFPPVRVAVNLSARQFQLAKMEDVVASVLRRTGLDPSRLELELTETLAFQDPAGITATLEDLRTMGVHSSIDDFGTGYSGLSYLDRFPVTSLKIDKSFVSRIGPDRPESPIVLAVIALAKGLNMEVVAEGVETEQQLEFLREHGVDQMQGFLFSQAVPAEQFESLLMLETISPGPGRLHLVESLPLVREA